MFHPSLSERLWTCDHIHCCHPLAHPVFSDLMFASTVCTSIYHRFWLDQSGSNEILFLLFASDSFFPACMVDNVKEMIQEKLYQKPNNATYQLNQLMPYTYCQMQQIVRLKSSRLETVISCYGPGHQNSCGSASSWMPISSPILPIALMN